VVALLFCFMFSAKGSPVVQTNCVFIGVSCGGCLYLLVDILLNKN